MKIRDLMTKTVFSCRPESLASEAARIMWEQDVGCVPVVDANNRPIGMVTDRDLCMTAYMQGQSLAAMRVSSATSKQIYTCRTNDSIAEAERIMMERKVRRLPVVDESGKLVGLLSLNDIALANAQNPVAKAVDHLFGQVSETLAAISEHRAPPASREARSHA